MKQIAALIIQVLLFSVCCSQTNKIDSLRRTLPSLKDSAKVEQLIHIWREFAGGGRVDPIKKEAIDSAIRYVNLIEEESRKINYVHGIAESYGLRGAIQNRYYHNYTEAVKMLREALSWFNRTNNKKRIHLEYIMLFVAFDKLNLYNDAEWSLQMSYEWGKRNGKIDFMHDALGTMYEYYRDAGEYDKAFEAFRKEEELTDSITGKKDISYENFALAELQRRLGNYAIALDYYRRLIDTHSLADLNHAYLWIRISYPELFALNGQFDSARYYYNLIDSSKLNDHDRRFYLVSIGEFYLLQKKYDQALSPLLRGLKGHRDAGDTNYVKRALIDVAKAYAGLGDDATALTYVHQAIDMSIRSHAKQYMMDGYQILYEIYQRRNQSDSALKYYQKYVTQKDIVANDVVKGKFAAYNYQQQIALLDKEKILEKQKSQKEKTRRNILIGAFAIALLLAGFLIRNIQLKRRKDKLQHLMTEANTQLENRTKEQQLVEIRQQKTELEMQALRAQMNPHFIFNSLNSINMFILENNKLQASEYLSKFSRLVRLILQNSQEAFIPLERELEALQLYLELESLRFDNKFEYKISVNKEIDSTVLKVPPLIIQPYVENAIWHGLMHKKDKGHLEITLYPDEKIVFCKITDDGVGRNKATEIAGNVPQGHKSTGMRITADRIAMARQNKQEDMHVTIKDLVMADGSVGGTEVLFAIPARE